MDVGHYEIILDHHLWVPSIAQINLIFLNTIKFTICYIYSFFLFQLIMANAMLHQKLLTPQQRMIQIYNC